MGRHVFASSDNNTSPMRRQVSLIRRDLLLEGELVNRDTGEVITLPITATTPGNMPNYALVGPSVALSLVRRVVPSDIMPVPLQRQLHERFGDMLPQYAAVWKLLDLDTLWRTGALPPPREPTSATETDELPHPFKPELVTGGSASLDQAPDGWRAVKKGTTTWVSDGAFRLAAAMHGSADDGAKRISDLAQAAWERDVERCLELHALVAAAMPDGLLEAEEVLALRPSSSVSQEVEKAVLDEALVWLGVDPTEELKRKPGRRKQAQPDSNIIIVDVDAEGRVHGHLRRAYGGWPTQTKLTDVSLTRLVELLGLLRTDLHGNDADLLEAYMDAAHPAWRDLASADEPGPSTAADPWEVLGIQRGASQDEVVAAYRRLMMKVHPDTGGLPPWMSRAVSDAYRALKDVFVREAA